MQAVADFLKNIGNLLLSVVDFVIGLFEDLVYMIQLIGKFLIELPYYFQWLPPRFVSMIILIFGVVVVYKILGREG